MKKSALFILLIGSLLTGSFTASATTGKAKRTKTRQVSLAQQQQNIGNLISIAASEITSESIISVNVRITDQNQIQVVEINTENKDLEKMIIKAIHGKKIKGNYENINMVMNIKIVPEKEQVFIVY